MTNLTSKEEIVAFDKMLEGFQDATVMTKAVSIYNTDQTMMERTSDVIWRPQPYIATSYDGMDQTANFNNYTQLSVPSTIGYKRSVPFAFDALELRDQLQSQRLGDSAKQKLASDINTAVLNVASQGTLVVKRTAAASGFDDVALCEAIFNEQGIMFGDRHLALSTRDYNSMAGNLAARQTLSGKPLTAYDKAYVGEVASFSTLKLDYANRLTAAAGGLITISTLSSANNYWIPQATSVATTGERGNVDNRYQTVTVSATANVKAGDYFTIAGVNAVHHITKNDTGQLKTFRVHSVINGTTMVISPPLISSQGSTQAEASYQNVIVAPSATAAIVWMNTADAALNIFWHKDAIEILPGRYALTSGGGFEVMRATTDAGIELVMTKSKDINTLKTFYRFDTVFGVVNKQPEMSGVLLFSQV